MTQLPIPPEMLICAVTVMVFVAFFLGRLSRKSIETCPTAVELATRQFFKRHAEITASNLPADSKLAALLALERSFADVFGEVVMRQLR